MCIIKRCCSPGGQLWVKNRIRRKRPRKNRPKLQKKRKLPRLRRKATSNLTLARTDNQFLIFIILGIFRGFVFTEPLFTGISSSKITANGCIN
jgi:hypothetical protein